MQDNGSTQTISRSQADAGLLELVASIRGHLDKVTTAALTDDELRHLAAIDEWMADLARAPEDVAAHA